MASESLQAGVQQAWLMFYDINGDPSGNTTTPLGNGLSRGGYRFRGIQEMPSGIPEADAVQIPGDDTSLGSILFSSDAPREFLMNFGVMDLDLEGLLQNTAVETLGDMKFGLIDSPDAILANVSLITQGRAILDNGKPGYMGFIYPNVQIQPLNRETFSGRTAGVIRYKGVAQLAFNNPWGTTIVNRSGVPTSGYARPFQSPFPITMDALRGDGAVTAFPLNRGPVSVTKTKPFSDKVALTVSGVSSPPPLMTLSAPILINRPGLVVYEYQ